MMEDKQIEDYLISGPPFQLKFSPVDQVTPPIYSRRVLIFSRHHDLSNPQTAEAVLTLRAGLQSTINEFPMLAGQMGYDQSPEGGGPWTIRPGQARLRVKHIDDMEFSKLRDSNFSESMLPADLISSVPTLADPQTEWHACRLQANFIRGGLLLVISIMHTTMDGFGITKVIESLARNCRQQASLYADGDGEALNPPPTKITTETPLPNPRGLDRSALSGSSGGGGIIASSSPSAEKEAEEAAPDLTRLAAYTLVTDPAKTNLGSPSSSRIITTTFRIPVPSLQALKRDASPLGRMSKDWITTHDAVNALCWRVHARIRVQAGMIPDPSSSSSSSDQTDTTTTTTRFAFPVDFRKFLTLPQEEDYDYIGNAVLMNKVELPLAELLHEKRGLRKAASKIRGGVREVLDDSSYVRNFVAVARSLGPERAGRLKINLKLEDDHRRRNAGFGSTSYKSFGGLNGLDWGEEMVGKFERMRLSSGVTGEGMSVVMPVLGDGSWEVTLTVEEELVEKLRGDEEWRRYVEV